MSPWSRRKEETIERAERKSQRARREAVAGRLLQKVPGLASLSIEIHETRPGGVVSDNHYTRRIVLEHAPALFEVPCSYADCSDGGYDVTLELLDALLAGRRELRGEQTCRGRCGGQPCARLLRYVAVAAYRDGHGASARSATETT
jgi:hypothetical protein